MLSKSSFYLSCFLLTFQLSIFPLQETKILGRCSLGQSLLLALSWIRHAGFQTTLIFVISFESRINTTVPCRKPHTLTQKALFRVMLIYLQDWEVSPWLYVIPSCLVCCVYKETLPDILSASRKGKEDKMLTSKSSSYGFINPKMQQVPSNREVVVPTWWGGVWQRIHKMQLLTQTLHVVTWSDQCTPLSLNLTSASWSHSHY